jgi:hypothetical protein
VARLTDIVLGFEAAQNVGNRKNHRTLTLKALWSRRLGYQIIELPEFDEIFRAVRRALRQAKLP